MKKVINNYHDSLDSFVSFAENRKLDSSWKREASRSKNDMDFYGNATFNQAIKLARYGWTEGRDLLANATASAASAISNNMTPSFFMDVGGAYPIAALAASGDPACMVNPTPYEQTAKPTVALNVGAAFNCTYRTHQINNFGGALCAWIDKLEALGQSIELTLSYYNGANDEKSAEPDSHNQVRIKRAGEPLNLDTIAFALIHPAMNRRLQFSHLESLPLGESHYAYGRKKDVPQKRRDSSALYLNGLEHGGNQRWNSPERAIESFKQDLENASDESGLNLIFESE
tara:strand:- start:268 stop:1125 length:858 start_codon:yes stop_codon:yes gene_type:complete